MLRVVFTGGRFICHCSFNERHYPKDAGFRWDQQACQWYTPSHGVAHRLVRFADESAKREIQRKLLTIEDWTGAIPYPPKLTPKDFQIKIAAPYVLARNRSYLAADPGMGKTIIAALVWNALQARTLYTCPPHMVANVEEEFRKWCVGTPLIARVGRDDWVEEADIVVMPDSLVTRENSVTKAYRIGCEKGSTLIIDEAQRFKNVASARTKVLYEHYTPRFKRVIFMSGTPMPNRRPMELYPMLAHCAPETIGFMSRFDFGLRYCGGYRDGRGHWDFSGRTNFPELMSKVTDKFMLRLRKRDHLKELPPVVSEIVFIDDDEPPVLASMSARMLKRYSPSDLLKAELGDEHVSTYRKKLGEAKAEAAAQFIRGELEGGDEAFLVFAIHKAAIEKLTHALRAFDPLVITGDVEKDKRFGIAKLFQSDRRRRLLILNIQAGGIGFNLTKASRVVFAEFSWVPDDNQQAIDRADRIGQTQDVLAQYLVYRNSFDRDVLEAGMKKVRGTEAYV